MADIVKTVGIIFQGTNQVTPAIAQIEASLAGISTAANSAAPAVNAVGAATSNLGTSSGSVFDLARAFQLLAGSVVVKEFVDANVAIENFGRAITIVSGSTAEAASSLSFVRGISETLGLEISSTARSFVSLSAATNGTLLQGQAARDIFEAVSKAMSLLGKSSSDTQGALLAIQQMISKGVVQAEELRGQLGERLPGAFQIAARAMGMTTAELGAFVKSGQLTAEEFLPKFAAELNNTFGDTTRVETFNASLNRLINSLKDLATSSGGSAVFAMLTDGVVALTEKTKASAVELLVLGDFFRALYDLARGQPLETFLIELSLLKDKAQQASAALDDENQSLAETNRLSRQAAEGKKVLNESVAETERLIRQAGGDVGKAISDLGLNVDKINKDLVASFISVANSGTQTGAVIIAAFEKAKSGIDTLHELEDASTALAAAAGRGDITWDQYAKTVTEASQAFLKNTGYSTDNAAALKKQADETKRAEENAAKLALELEKIASNERIKTLEFKAEIDVARIQADAEKVVAAFDSINVGIESTADVLGKVFGLFNSLGSMDSAARNAVFAQIDKENALREKAFTLQEKLTQAQIDNLNAQTKALTQGDAIIKIDGAGLQPHLEAFMWEILKAIQVRANRDGLAFLLGTS